MRQTSRITHGDGSANSPQRRFLTLNFGSARSTHARERRPSGRARVTRVYARARRTKAAADDNNQTTTRRQRGRARRTQEHAHVIVYN